MFHVILLVSKTTGFRGEVENPNRWKFFRIAPQICQRLWSTDSLDSLAENHTTSQLGKFGGGVLKRGGGSHGKLDLVFEALNLKICSRIFFLGPVRLRSIEISLGLDVVSFA